MCVQILHAHEEKMHAAGLVTYCQKQFGGLYAVYPTGSFTHTDPVQLFDNDALLHQDVEIQPVPQGATVVQTSCTVAPEDTWVVLSKADIAKRTKKQERKKKRMVLLKTLCCFGKSAAVP